MTMFNELIFETFRLNGELLAAGDRLVADLSLTSARWQVLGAVGMSPVPLTVAQIARNMGLSRQAVQRIVNELALFGVLGFSTNPRHQRAKLVIITAKGQAIFVASMQRQGPWAKALSQGLDATQIDTALGVLRTLRTRLQMQNEFQPTEKRHVEIIT